MNKHTVYAVEGIDRLGKSTLIDSIMQRLGYYEVIHFAKPKQLDYYRGSLEIYQRESFINSMVLASSGARIIFDRWHLGEAVYAPLYRGYSGDYVFELESHHDIDLADVRLILLTEDFDYGRHFVDDGESLGAIENREKEQALFLAAFEKSHIKDKRVISVTDPGLGGFKPKDWILAEALE
jgi:thymidylate kinase